MKCKFGKNDLVQFLTGAMSAGDTARFEAHLEECQRCGEALGQLVASDRLPRAFVCPGFRLLFPLDEDKALGPGLASALASHREGCAQCSEWAEDWKRAAQALKPALAASAAEESAATAVVTGVRDRLAREKTRLLTQAAGARRAIPGTDFVDRIFSRLLKRPESPRAARFRALAPALGLVALFGVLLIGYQRTGHLAQRAETGRGMVAMAPGAKARPAVEAKKLSVPAEMRVAPAAAAPAMPATMPPASRAQAMPPAEGEMQYRRFTTEPGAREQIVPPRGGAGPPAKEVAGRWMEQMEETPAQTVVAQLPRVSVTPSGRLGAEVAAKRAWPAEEEMPALVAGAAAVPVFGQAPGGYVPLETRLATVPVVPIIQTSEVAVSIQAEKMKEPKQEFQDYRARVEATYTVVAPSVSDETKDLVEKGKRKLVAEMFVPYPDGARLLSDANLKVDGREAEQVTFDQSGARWKMELKPDVSRTVLATYTASGTGQFLYAPAQNQRLRNFSVEVRVGGTKVAPKTVDDSLPPTKEGKEGDEFLVSWKYKDLIPTRNVGVRLPTMPTTVLRLPSLEAMIVAAMLLGVLFLVCVHAASRAEQRRPAEYNYLLLAFCFVLFYPLVVFLAPVVPLEQAFLIAFVVTGALCMNYVARMFGAAFAAKYGLVCLVALLGLCSLAILLPRLAGLLIVAATVLIVAFYTVMLPMPPPAVQEPAGLGRSAK